MKKVSIYKCKDDTNYIIIQQINKETIKYIVADSRLNYCATEESPITEIKEELKHFELIN